MMRIKITLAFAMFMAITLLSCSSNNTQTVKGPEELNSDRVTEFTYEGCEYVRIGFGERAWGSHKGNCKNPIHKIN